MGGNCLECALCYTVWHLYTFSDSTFSFLAGFFFFFFFNNGSADPQMVYLHYNFRINMKCITLVKGVYLYILYTLFKFYLVLSFAVSSSSLWLNTAVTIESPWCRINKVYLIFILSGSFIKHYKSIFHSDRTITTWNSKGISGFLSGPQLRLVSVKDTTVCWITINAPDYSIRLLKQNKCFQPLWINRTALVHCSTLNQSATFNSTSQ